MFNAAAEAIKCVAAATLSLGTVPNACMRMVIIDGNLGPSFIGQPLGTGFMLIVIAVVVVEAVSGSCGLLHAHISCFTGCSARNSGRSRTSRLR